MERDERAWHESRKEKVVFHMGPTYGPRDTNLECDITWHEAHHRETDRADGYNYPTQTKIVQLLLKVLLRSNQRIAKLLPKVRPQNQSSKLEIPHRKHRRSRAFFYVVEQWFAYTLLHNR
jgi:hypothetical protein